MTTSQGIDPITTPTPPTHRRRRIAIVAGSIAAALVIGGAIGYTVGHNNLPDGYILVDNCHTTAGDYAQMEAELAQLVPAYRAGNQVAAGQVATLAAQLGAARESCPNIGLG